MVKSVRGASVVGIVLFLCQAPGAARQQRTSDPTRFDVASVRLGPGNPVPGNTGFAILPGGRLRATNVRLSYFIRFAYELQPAQRIIGGEPLVTQYFTVDAQAAQDTPIPSRADVFGATWTKSPFTMMTRRLLEERFALRTSWKTEMVTVQALRLVRPGQIGPRLKRLHVPCVHRVDIPRGAGDDPTRCSITTLDGVMAGTVDNLAELATYFYFTLSSGDSPTLFVDDTGLDGAFELSTKFNILTAIGRQGVQNSVRQPYEDYPSFTDALRDDLGLRLERQRRPMQMLVIDHIEAPTEN
jgi:uncharacterized protein (TIGR03435 family)